MELSTRDKVLTGVAEEIFLRVTEMIKDVNQPSSPPGTLSDMKTTAKLHNYKVKHNSESIFLFFEAVDAKLACLNHSEFCFRDDEGSCLV